MGLLGGALHGLSAAGRTVVCCTAEPGTVPDWLVGPETVETAGPGTVTEGLATGHVDTNEE